MGFFSWYTQDTHRSISNFYSDRVTFTVVMHDDKGNQFVEDNYEGYGRFGGKDYYILLAEMNGIQGDSEELVRSEAIRLAFSGEPCKFPNLTETKIWEWIDQKPKTCKFQGFFY